jgi:hypothetical protein
MEITHREAESTMPLDYNFTALIIIFGLWAVATICLFKRFSGSSLPAETCRIVGYSAIAIGSIGAALMQLVEGEPVAPDLLANLMLSFSSAAGGVYLSKGYLV